MTAAEAFIVLEHVSRHGFRSFVTADQLRQACSLALTYVRGRMRADATIAKRQRAQKRARR